MMTKEEQMKVINHGVHDLVGATCTIGAWVSVMKMQLENGTLNLDELPKRLDNIERCVKRIDEVGDYFYKTFKEQ